MAPATRGVKRGAVGGAAQAKKAKTDTFLVAVANTLLEKAADVPADSRKMLAAMIDKSLGVPSDERGAQQNLVVDMIGDVLDKIATQMAQVVATEDAKVVDTDARKAELDAKTEEAWRVVAAKREVCTTHKEALGCASAAVAKAKIAVGSAEAEQRNGDQSLVTTAGKKGSFESALEGSFKELKSGTWTTEQEAEEPSKALLAIVGELELDVSLLAALPAVLCKPPSSRGQFDNLAMDQLETCLSERIASLASVLAAGEPGKVERASAVQAAQAALEAATQAETEAASALVTAQSEHKDAESASAEACQHVLTFEPEFEKMTKVRNDVKTIHDEFTDFEVKGYHTYREKLSLKKRKEMKAAAEAEQTAADAMAEAEQPAADAVAEEAVGTLGAE